MNRDEPKENREPAEPWEPDNVFGERRPKRRFGRWLDDALRDREAETILAEMYFASPDDDPWGAFVDALIWVTDNIRRYTKPQVERMVDAIIRGAKASGVDTVTE